MKGAADGKPALMPILRKKFIIKVKGQSHNLKGEPSFKRIKLTTKEHNKETRKCIYDKIKITFSIINVY